jgi:predicted alpha/beta hydrolase
MQKGTKGSKSFQPNLPIVFIQHGLTQSSDAWVANDETRSIAYMLANQGFDVFLGNGRGNKYALKSDRFPIDSNEYADYSFSEHANYDLPALFMKVKEVTQRSEKFIYIGYS